MSAFKGLLILKILLAQQLLAVQGLFYAIPTREALQSMSVSRLKRLLNRMNSLVT